MESLGKKAPKARLYHLQWPCLSAIFAIIIFLLAFHPALSQAKSGQWPPKFKAWLMALTYTDENPGDMGAKTAKNEKALLERFRPRVFIAPKGRLPVDFYGFYLPNTVVRDDNGAIIKKSPTKLFLKSIERKAGLYLVYQGPDSPCEGRGCVGYMSTGYGRVYREMAHFRTNAGIKKMPLIILKYNFAFTYSGVPAEIGGIKEAILSLFMDPGKVHELDIHGAIHIILDAKQRPLVLLLAQHNYFRSYVFGKDIAEMPGDNRVKVCFALRSNEPYPCPSGKAPLRRRTVGNPVNMSYVINGTDRPFLSGEDLVFGPESGARAVPYRLKFLPHKDPLYVSWIPLGAKEKILFFDSYYRKGPPGMDMNTWPRLKKYSDIMQFWYLRDGNSEDAALLKGAFRSFFDVDFDRVLGNNGERLYNDLIGY